MECKRLTVTLRLSFLSRYFVTHLDPATLQQNKHFRFLQHVLVTMWTPGPELGTAGSTQSRPVESLLVPSRNVFIEGVHCPLPTAWLRSNLDEALFRHQQPAMNPSTTPSRPR